MSGSVFDAAVLLAADGLVAVGRVLRGLRRPSGAEVRAQAHVDALNALEDSQDGLEPGQLSESVAWEAQSNRFSRDAIEALNDARWCGVHATVVAFCKDHHRASAGAPECWACGCPASRHVGNAGIHWPCEDCDCVDLLLHEYAEKRSAAVSTPAADNTTVDHLEAAYNYHRPQANYNGDLVWGCEGCNWHGPTIQAHSRHRFQILADMKNATHRIQEQLGGAS